MIWESDCISFAQGILDELIRDIKSLKKVEETESIEVGRLTKSHMGSSSANESSLNSSQLINPNNGSIRSSMIGEAKKPLYIQGIKITSGNENGEAMKGYKETVEKYIKDYLIHQPSSRAIYTNDALFGQIRSTFQSVRLVYQDGGFF